MSVDPGKVLFVGQGKSAVCWYRCALPATFLGADWVGMAGIPPKVAFVTGLVKRKSQMPAFDSYDVLVVQQPRGEGWKKVIRGLQERGVKVVFEIDDYVHAIAKMEDHDFRKSFDKEALRDLEMNMRICDAVICSTEYIAAKYRRFNTNIHVCRNGIDPARYNLTRPPRPTVNIGWAGATGHARAAIPWFKQVFEIMEVRPNTTCVTIGQNFADAFKPHFGEARAISIPWTLLDVYPAAMTMFDIALGPASTARFFRGKSDLRWLEAAALGVPIVAHPAVYGEIEHGVTGMLADTPELAGDHLLELVDDDKLRLEIGSNAREYVLEHRSMAVASKRWSEVLDLVVAGR